MSNVRVRGLIGQHDSTILTAVLILLYFPSYTESSEATGATAASHTMDRFCRNSLLYSGNGNDRGDTAQYDRRATPMVENESFCNESKFIFDSAPGISTP